MPPHPARPVPSGCRQGLEEAGVEPLAALNLRAGNPSPVVLSKTDLSQLTNGVGLEVLRSKGSAAWTQADKPHFAIGGNHFSSPLLVPAQ